MIGNVEVWTSLLLDEVTPATSGTLGVVLVAMLLERQAASAAEFSNLARQIVAEGRLDELWVDRLDDPPTEKARGGAIGHVITHNMHHRAEVLHILGRLGVAPLPEGDLMGWESLARHG